MGAAASTAATAAMIPSVLSALASAASVGSGASGSSAGLAAKGMAKGAGGGLLTVLDQMQSMAGSGTLAPADMPAFKTVTGAVGWTTQLPVPFWNEMGESPMPQAVAV